MTIGSPVARSAAANIPMKVLSADPHTTATNRPPGANTRAISDADRHPRLTYEATIHHGIPVGEFTFQPDPGDYLLFYGRFHPDKGAAEAIAVAKAMGMPLRMAGIIQDEGA